VVTPVVDVVVVDVVVVDVVVGVLDVVPVPPSSGATPTLSQMLPFATSQLGQGSAQSWGPLHEFPHAEPELQNPPAP